MLYPEAFISKIINGDSLNVLKYIPDDSIDLIFTSPPYADLRNYEGYGTIKPDSYVEWFKPFTCQFYRILKPTGSFILNINDRIVNGERHLYVFDSVSMIKREIGFKYFERFIWGKTNANPWSSKKRFTDEIEYVFWFYKNDTKVYTDRVRKPYKESSLKRFKTRYSGDKNGFRKFGEILKPNILGAKPGNLLLLHTSMQKGHKHVAPFPIELSEWFIKASTDETDVVLDPFVGTGTTCLAAKRLNRRYIGIDINKDYCDYAMERLMDA